MHDDSIKKALESAIDNINEAIKRYRSDPQDAWLALVAAGALIESCAHAFDRMRENQEK